MQASFLHLTEMPEFSEHLEKKMSVESDYNTYKVNQDSHMDNITSH